MDKFWEWMEEKNYSDLDLRKGDSEYYIYDDMPKQMLIGYMYEFLCEHDPVTYNVPDMERDFLILKDAIEELT
jgi:hypothetical protein